MAGINEAGARHYGEILANDTGTLGEIKVDHIVMILAQVEAHISDQVRSLWPNRLQPAGESGAAQPTLKPVDEENCC